MKVKHLIEAVIGILIGLALYPAVAAATDDAVGNATGVALTLLPLIPTIYVIVVIAGAAAYVYTSN
jgi:hypothetical protein